MKKSKFLKKSLAMLLALMLVVAMIPLSASAAEGDPTVYVDNVLATGSGTEYSVTATSTTVDITYVADKGVTLVAVDKDGNEITTLTGIKLDEEATKDGDVYTLGLRTKVSQDGDDAAVTKDYTLKITVKEAVKSSDATIKALTNSAANLDNMTNYTIGDNKITIWTAFGKAQVSALAEKDFVTTSDKVQSVVPDGVKSVTVTAEDGSTKTYTIELKTEDGFTAFTVPNQTGETEIETKGGDDSTVTINVPYDTDFAEKVVPTFSVSSKIIAVTTSDTDSTTDVVTSGKTEVTLTDNKDGTATAVFYLWTGKKSGEEGKVTVTLKKPTENPEAALKTIKVDSSNVTEVTGTTVNVEMPTGYDFSKGTAVDVTVTFSEGATVSIPAQNNITPDGSGKITGVNITGKTFIVRVVSNDEKTTTNYTINLTAAASAEAKINDFTVKGKLDGKDVSYSVAWNGLNGTLTLPYAFSANLGGLTMYIQTSTGAGIDKTFTNGSTALNASGFFTTGKDGDKVSIKVKASDDTEQTYTITLKYEAAKTGRVISSAEFVGTNNVADITEDNTYGVTVGTTNDTNGDAVKTLKVSVPYSFAAPATSADVYFSALNLSNGAKAYVWDSTAMEVTALDAAKSGPQSVKEVSVPTDALDADGKLITTKATKIYVLSEQGYVGKTYGAEADLAKAATTYYVYGVKADAATGNTMTSMKSTVDTNVTASLSGTTITVTVPNSYDSGDQFTLNFSMAKLATLVTDKTVSAKPISSDNGSAESTTATKFYVDGNELYIADGPTPLTVSKAGTLYVKSESGAYQAYTLKLVVAEAETGASLTGVKVNSTSASISGKNVNVTLPFGTNLYPVKLTLTASKMATILVNGEAYNKDKNYDLNTDITIKVTSEDLKTTNVYTLKASLAAQFSDISESDWYYNNVMRAVELGILSGYTDGTFRPNNSITRQDFAIMLAQSLGHDNDEEATSPFKDVSDSDYGVSSIAYLYEQGIVAGDNNGNFNPNANITRQEAAIMLAKAFKATGTTSDKFTDDASIASWAKSFVYAAKAAGLMNGDTNGSFRPTSTITRAEAASAMVNAIDK